MTDDVITLDVTWEGIFWQQVPKIVKVIKLFENLPQRIMGDFFSGAPLLSIKSTHPRKFGNHVTVHRPPTVRPHHRTTNVYSHTFS